MMEFDGMATSSKKSKTKNSFQGVPVEKIIEWYRLGFTARQIDNRAGKYINKSMGWSYHARCSGHEPIQIALGTHFRANKDFLFPYYRDTATVLAAGLSPYEIFLNGLSKSLDVASGGRHMSNHFAKPSIGIQNVSSCTGNHTLHAVGLARAAKYYKSDARIFCSQGDASVSEGYCYEAINGASREGLGVIFVIQNNGYGISVPASEQTANACVADNFSGFKNLHIIRCNGLDFFDSYKAMQEAVAVSKKMPVIVHAQCVRIGAHSNSDAQELYRPKEEIAQAMALDPIPALRTLVLREKLATEAELGKLEAEVEELLNSDAQRAESAPSPDPATVQLYVTPPEYKQNESGKNNATFSDKVEKLREAITRTLVEEFEFNKDTFLWGQDVASFDKGGVFNLTKGMLKKFGKGRIFNAPIAEDFIVGTANGMSRFKKDIRVVIEAAQFADYVWPAMEQIVEMGHEYWRTNGQFAPNVTLRLASGGYISGGLYHSQNVEAIMSHLPGIRVVYPAYADDAAGLLRTCIRSEGITFFLEPKFLYNRMEASGKIHDAEYAIPFGKGRVRIEGDDLSIISYGNTVHMAEAVARTLLAENFSVEVFDLRSIKPLDVEGIKTTVKKTGKVLIVHEDHLFSGIGGEVASIIAEHCFMDLDAPVKRVAALDIPIGFAKSLEQATLPNTASIEKAARDLLAY